MPASQTASSAMQIAYAERCFVPVLPGRGYSIQLDSVFIYLIIYSPPPKSTIVFE